MSNPSRFYGWTIAVAIWFTYLLGTAFAYYGASITIAPMAKELHFDKTTVGIGFSIINLMWGMSSIITGWMLTRCGLRITIVIGALILTAGGLLMAYVVHDRWWFFGTFGVLMGLGLSLASNLPAQTAVTLWFSRRRALVMSLVLSSSGAGGFLGPQLLQRIIGSSGDWRTAWLLTAASSFLVAAIAAIFIRDRPADLGQWPDGIAPVEATADAPTVALDDALWRPRDLLRSSSFWLVLFSSTTVSMPLVLAVAHGAAHLEKIGNSPATAAWGLGLLLLLSVPGKLIAGFLCDRIEVRYVWVAMMLSQVLGLIVLTSATSSITIVLFAVLLGTGSGGSLICWISLLGKYFGPRSFPSVVGLSAVIMTPVFSLMPTFAGFLYDQFGTYSTTLWILVCTSLTSVVIISLARVPRPPTAI